MINETIFEHCEAVVLMWIVRLISMLALTVALLLPAPLFRDCCCSRRAEATRVNQPKLRPCCQARIAAQKSTQAKRAWPRTTSRAVAGLHLSAPTCHCQPVIAVSAIVTHHDQAVQQVLDTDVVEALSWASTFAYSQPARFHADDSLQHTGPPLRKTLCRWVI